LVYIGAGLSVLGLIGLVICILRAAKAKREAATPEEMQAKLEPLIPLNLGSLFLSIIGLMCIVVGILL